MHLSKYYVLCLYIMRIILVCAICVTVASVPIEDDSQLLSVIVLFRHGDRVPSKFAPLDPYGNSTFWPTGRGELTNLGMHQMYELGKWLRSRYHDYLPAKYDKKDIYVRSSSVDRCLMSAELNLAGLYPPVGDQIWNTHLLWRPIPVYTVPKGEDFIFESAASCPKYDEAYDELLAKEEFKKIDESNSDFYKYLGEHLGVRIKSFTDIAEWYNTMKAEDDKGLKLADWTKKVYPTEMLKWTELCYKIPTNNQRLARFATGMFLETISNHINAVVRKSDEVLAAKMVLFSGHQTNIADVTNSLGMFRSAPFAGALIFELRKKPQSSEVYINVLFKANDNLDTLELENCTKNCNVKDFLRIVEPLRVTSAQIEFECKISKN